MKRVLMASLLALANITWGAPITVFSDGFTDAQTADSVLALGGGVTRELLIVAPGGLAPVQNTMEAGGGLLDMTNGVGDNSTMILSYAFGGGSPVPAGAMSVTALLRVLMNDGNAATITLISGGSGAVAIPGNSSNVLASFTADPGLTGLEFTFSGLDGWDMAVESLALMYEVPEPATMALMGAGLIAVALLRRQ